MAVKTPIESAEEWLDMADLALSKKLYEQSLYAMEMASEIALKGVLMAIKISVPKTHNIGDTVRTYLYGNQKLSQEFLEHLPTFLEDFKTLLELRPAVGYGFESRLSHDELASKAIMLMPRCTKLVKECAAETVRVIKKK
jgi:HEPN domain-containing protein